MHERTLLCAERRQVRVRPSMVTDLMSSIVRILDIRDLRIVIYTVPIIPVHEECSLRAGLGELVGDVPRVLVGTVVEGERDMIGELAGGVDFRLKCPLGE